MNGGSSTADDTHPEDESHAEGEPTFAKLVLISLCRPSILLASLIIAFNCSLATAAFAQVSPKTPAKASEKSGSLDERVKDLEDRLLATNVRINRVVDRLASELVQISCTTSGFKTIQAKEYGMPFTLSCQKVEPFMEGHRIVLAIGNPYSIAFSGLTAQVLYGKDFGEAYMTNPKINISSPDDLAPGTWIVIPVVVTPSKS